MIRKHTTIVAAAAVVAAAGFLVAGPLTPPAGPVTSTYKTLTEVEPRTAINATNTPGNSIAAFVIGQPGSYYLTGDMTVPTGKNGILIYASGVTIDLNGFSIRGNSGSLAGITLASVYWSDLTVKNGDISTCGNGGIDFSTGWASHISNVSTTLNAGPGVSILDGIVEHCTAYYNSANGFMSVTGWGTFLDCTSTYNSGCGFYSTGNSLVESCTSNNNGNAGFFIGQDSTIRNCIADENTLQGIVATSTSTITNNQVRRNGGSSAITGIWLQNNGNACEGNDVSNSYYGIFAGGTGNIIVKNRVAANNTNFYIVPGNHVGLIVNPSTNASLINGSTGGGLGSTDPNANFTY